MTPHKGEAGDTGSQAVWPTGALAGTHLHEARRTPPASVPPMFALFLLMSISLYLAKLSAHLAFENWLERITPLNKTGANQANCCIRHLVSR